MIIGVLIRDLAHIEKGYIVFKEEKDQGFILNEAYDFEVLLYDAYNQIMFYGQSDATVMIAGFKSLRLIKVKASKENTKIIDEYARHSFNKLADHSYGDLEHSKIQKEYMDLTTL